MRKEHSYIRTRGLTLLAYNAKWDKDYKIDEVIDKYLKHITDAKLSLLRSLKTKMV